MVDQSLIYSAKMAARITTDFYDVEVERLLNAAMLDLGVAGVVIPSELDDLVSQAAITYFLMNFGQPDNYDRLKASYDEQKAQLSTKTGYTQWTEAT
ncbi:MAG: DNA-packaging protein [Ruminococcus sp.]|nr:DNA-packaging protein [Ruminococcus sp.]